MPSRLKPIALLIAIGLSLSIPAARAELITLPAVPVTVADCRPGDHWGRVNGIARCVPDQPPAPVDTCNNHGLYATNQGGGSTFVPGVGTCYKAYVPPVTQCKYSTTEPVTMLMVGPMDCNGADDGCSATGFTAYWGSTTVAGDKRNDIDLTFNYNEVIAWVDSTINRLGYSRGAVRRNTQGNGNYSNLYVFELCR